MCIRASDVSASKKGKNIYSRNNKVESSLHVIWMPDSWLAGWPRQDIYIHAIGAG